MKQTMTGVLAKFCRLNRIISGPVVHQTLESCWHHPTSRLLSTTFSPPTMTHAPIKSALIDLSGTIHIDDTAIPASQDALRRLRESGVKVKFVTNTTKESMAMLHNRLEKLNFDIKRHEIFTSLTAARRLIEKKGVHVRPLMFLSKSAKEDFEGISEENPNAVLIGLAPDYFSYAPMNEAFRLLIGGAPLIAIHKARYFMKKDGLYLGPGGFVSALEYAADTKAEVVGKPEASFFLEAIRDIEGDPDTTVMIGDDARDDVGGAMRAGMMGILVQTGKYRAGDEGKIDPGPTAICKDFPAAVDYILAHRQ